MAINGGDTLADQLSNALALKTRIAFYYKDFLFAECSHVIEVWPCQLWP